MVLSAFQWGAAVQKDIRSLSADAAVMLPICSKWQVCGFPAACQAACAKGLMTAAPGLWPMNSTAPHQQHHEQAAPVEALRQARLPAVQQRLRGRQLLRRAGWAGRCACRPCFSYHADHTLPDCLTHTLKCTLKYF